MGREKKPTERKERAKRADPGGRERGMRRVERSRGTTGGGHGPNYSVFNCEVRTTLETWSEFLCVSKDLFSGFVEMGLKNTSLARTLLIVST